jgi:hypothetical protein
MKTFIKIKLPGYDEGRDEFLSTEIANYSMSTVSPLRVISLYFGFRSMIEPDLTGHFPL